MAKSLVFFNPSALLKTASLRRSPSAHFGGARRQIIRRNRLSIGRGMELPGFDGGQPRKDVPRATNASNGPVAPGGGPKLPIPNIPTWAKLVLGSIVCLAVPFYRRVLRVEDRVEKAAEAVVEVVEKVAETAEKVAADIADALPDNSKLKQQVLDIEHFAERIEKGAEIADEFIHKVDHITDELEDLAEPIVEEGEKMENKTQAKDKEETMSSSNL